MKLNCRPVLADFYTTTYFCCFAKDKDKDVYGRYVKLKLNSVRSIFLSNLYVLTKLSKSYKLHLTKTNSKHFQIQNRAVQSLESGR